MEKIRNRSRPPRIKSVPFLKISHISGPASILDPSKTSTWIVSATTDTIWSNICMSDMVRGHIWLRKRERKERSAHLWRRYVISENYYFCARKEISPRYLRTIHAGDLSLSDNPTRILNLNTYARPLSWFVSKN